jgi:hypothetical protein
MRDRRFLWGVVCVVVFAFALRVVPLFSSPLPFNPDGIKYAALVRDTLGTGDFPVARMATDEFGFTAFLAVASSLFGVDPLAVAQPVSAAVGASTILVGALLAERTARRLGLPDGRTRSAALLAGLVLAMEGIYLFRSMPTDEQTVGLLLAPAVVVAVDRWLVTGRAAWAVVGVAVAVVIPPLHNLTGLVTALAVVVLAVLAVRRRPTRRTVARALAAALLTCGYVFGFHVVLETVSAARIVQAERLVRVTDLFLAWVVLGVAGTVWYATTSSRVRQSVVLTVGSVGFGLVALNAVRPVFPGTTTTPGPLLVRLLALAVPVLLTALVVDALADEHSPGHAILTLVGAPLVVVATGLTARLTFDYLALIFRAQLFVHLPVLALAAVAVVTVGHDRRHWLRVGAVLALVLSVAVTVPVAYAGLELLNFDPVTTEAEFDATEHAADEFGTWATDDLGVRLTTYHGGNASVRPVLRWIQSGPPPDCPVVSQLSWTTTGAQLYPRSPAAISPERYAEWRGANDVVYVTTSPDPVSVVVPPAYSGGGCRR